MKTFLFSFLIAVLWGGLAYAVLAMPEQTPSAFSDAVLPWVQHGLNALQQAQVKIAEFGWNLELSSQSQPIAMGILLFFPLWFFLALLLGLGGFFKDLFAFFPLGK
jgi:hypothetical protein